MKEKQFNSSIFLTLFYRNTSQRGGVVGYSRKEEQQQTRNMEIYYSLLWMASLFLIFISLSNIATANTEYQLLWTNKGGIQVDISAFGDKIIANSNNKIYLLDSAGKLVWENERNDMITFNGVSLSPDGKYYLASKIKQEFYTGTKFKEIPSVAYYKEGKYIWENSVRVQPYFFTHMMDISSNGEFSVVGSSDGNVYLFDSSGKEIFKFETQCATKVNVAEKSQCINGVSIADNGNFVMGSDKLYLFNKNGEILWAKDGLSIPEITHDGNFIAAVEGNNIVVLNKKGNIIWKQKIEGNIQRASPSLDGETVAAISSYGKAYVFNQKGQIWSTEFKPNIQDIALSSDGNFIVLGTDSGISFFGKGIRTMYPADNDVINTSIPTFEWIGSSSSKKYIIRIDNEENETSVPKYTTLKALSAGTHTWSVKSVDSDGKESSWSATKTFLITTKENVTITKETKEDPLNIYSSIGAAIVIIIIAAIFVRPYYKRAKLKREMAMTPTDWCPNCHKFTGGAKTCPHCGKETLVSAGYDISKKAKKK